MGYNIFPPQLTAEFIPQGGAKPAAQGGNWNQKVLASEPQRYGQAQLYPVTLTASAGQLVAQRPTTTRTQLIIQNVSAFAVWINFGNQAAENNGLLLQGGSPGGSIYQDTVVSQDEIYAFSTGAATIIIVTMDQAFTLSP